jgi:hypothetical protein
MADRGPWAAAPPPPPRAGADPLLFRAKYYSHLRYGNPLFLILRVALIYMVSHSDIARIADNPSLHTHVTAM